MNDRRTHPVPGSICGFKLDVRAGRYRFWGPTRRVAVMSAEPASARTIKLAEKGEYTSSEPLSGRGKPRTSARRSSGSCRSSQIALPTTFAVTVNV